MQAEFHLVLCLERFFQDVFLFSDLFLHFIRFLLFLTRRTSVKPFLVSLFRKGYAYKHYTRPSVKANLRRL